jgi:hypothetical protein
MVRSISTTISISSEKYPSFLLLGSGIKVGFIILLYFLFANKYSSSNNATLIMMRRDEVSFGNDPQDAHIYVS